MPDIKYVCISDMHLGEEDSLSTNLKTASFDTDLSKPSPVLESFVECLNEIIGKNSGTEKPILILCGDILELALSDTNEAITAFQRFIELIMPKDKELFDNIIYVPGNHDHHLWEVARETQYINNYLKNKNVKDVLEKPWHTTNMFIEKQRTLPKEVLLTNVIQRYSHLKTFEIKTAYPNYGIKSEDNKKAVIFHHGHFVEPLYLLMTELMNMVFPNREKPKDVWDIESENYAWIDFFWSALGRSGKVGENVEKIYEKMSDETQFKKILNNLSKSIAEKYDIPLIPGDWLEQKALAKVFNFIFEKYGKRERNIVEKALSDQTEKGLRRYVNELLYNQILSEIEINISSENDLIPLEMTFVFGHTHKPFQEDMNFKKYDGWVNVYNTGGWIVESTEPEPIHGGSVVLIDEKFNSACLRMYNENKEPNEYKVKLEEAVHAGDEKNEFFKELEKRINSNKKPWNEFSKTVERARYVRAQNLRARINES